MPKIELIHDDCMNVMAKYPDNHFDLAICDPPYGIGIGASVGGANHLGRKVTVGGKSLSTPKFIRGLMTVKSQSANILMRLKGFQRTRLYGEEITLLSIYRTLHAGWFGTKIIAGILLTVSLLGLASKHPSESLSIGGTGCCRPT